MSNDKNATLRDLLRKWDSENPDKEKEIQIDEDRIDGAIVVALGRVSEDTLSDIKRQLENLFPIGSKYPYREAAARFDVRFNVACPTSIKAAIRKNLLEGTQSS